MSLRNQNGGFIRPGFDPLQVPNEPTSVAVTAGDTQLSVAFTAPANVGGGAISTYQAATTTGISATASTSPVVITGLSNGTSYSVRVWAINAYGPGPFGTGSGTPAAARGLFGGGFVGPVSNVIDYVNISTLSNATDFGDLTVQRYQLGACASTTRAVFGPGLLSPGYSNVMDYVTIASAGNAVDFGDFTFVTSGDAGCSSDTRGVFGGGQEGGAISNPITYITIATTGNGQDFGNLTVSRERAGACSSATRGVFGGGIAAGSSVLNVIDYITIASIGNATDFGDLTL